MAPNMQPTDQNSRDLHEVMQIQGLSGCTKTVPQRSGHGGADHEPLDLSGDDIEGLTLVRVMHGRTGMQVSHPGG
jgi:hypothetical protein